MIAPFVCWEPQHAASHVLLIAGRRDKSACPQKIGAILDPYASRSVFPRSLSSAVHDCRVGTVRPDLLVRARVPDGCACASQSGLVPGTSLSPWRRSGAGISF